MTIQLINVQKCSTAKIVKDTHTHLPKQKSSINQKRIQTCPDHRHRRHLHHHHSPHIDIVQYCRCAHNIVNGKWFFLRSHSAGFNVFRIRSDTGSKPTKKEKAPKPICQATGNPFWTNSLLNREHRMKWDMLCL